jgi:ribosomal protein S12 methylthiotransferase accessory factor
MRIDVTFPGQKRVAVRVGSFVIGTDQPPSLGGAGSAPAPYDLFLASVATCAGIYALSFCQARQLDTQGLGISVDAVVDPDSAIATRFDIALTLPLGFPEKYRTAIVRAVELCKVQKTIAAQPPFHVTIVEPVGHRIAPLAQDAA